MPLKQNFISLQYMQEISLKLYCLMGQCEIFLNYNYNYMESTNRSGLQCFEHPRQQITNYCVNAECLKPLCPDCVQQHTKVHQKQQIQSWKHCVNRSSSITKATLDELRLIYQSQHQSKGYKSVQVIQNENMRRLNILRQKYHRIIDDIFNAHEGALRLHIRNQYKIDQPDTSKLKLAIQQMQKIMMKLSHSNTVLPALKKCLLLDHKALLEYFRYMKNPYPKNITQNFFIENNITNNQLKILIEKCISFQSMENNNINSKYMSPQKSMRPSYSGDPFESIKIIIKDYFRSDCKNNYLHFFIPCSQEIKLLKLQEINKRNWITYNFKSNIILPSYFKSIITPHGDIYLTGGSQGQQKHNQIYKYNYEKNTLDQVGRMTIQRSSHSICYANNCIYIIGGFTQNADDVTRQCQVFNLQTRACSRIASLNTPSANSCAASFNDEYLFKFGGIYNKSVNENSKIIEMYSIKNNRWIGVTVDMPRDVPTLQLLSFSAAVQINQSQILVFGGYDNSEAEKPDRICYTLHVNLQKKIFSVRNYNKHPLPYAEAFWDNNPIVFQNHVIALQNITDQQDELTAIADERRVIVFDGQAWD